MVSVFTELYFDFDLQYSFRSSPAQLFSLKLFYIVHIERKYLGQPSTIFLFNYHVTSDNNLIPCNSIFFENFSNYFCVHCYQTRVMVLLLVTDMYQYPHPLILFHLFTQVTFTVSRPLHTIQIYLISHVSVSSVMVENTEAK